MSIPPWQDLNEAYLKFKEREKERERKGERERNTQHTLNSRAYLATPFRNEEFFSLINKEMTNVEINKLNSNKAVILHNKKFLPL